MRRCDVSVVPNFCHDDLLQDHMVSSRSVGVSPHMTSHDIYHDRMVIVNALSLTGITQR